MTYLYLKSIHIIFVVTWFAGLFYMVRLFIYSTEANQKNEPEKSILFDQLILMQKRLWNIITWPSAIITLIVGVWLTEVAGYWTSPWFQLKALFVLGLFAYQVACHRLHIQMTKNIFKYTSSQLRIWNEVATLLLFAIVFLVVLKSTLNWIWGVIGIFALGILLMVGIKLYKKLRKDA